MEEPLQQTVVTQNLQSALLAGRGQTRAVVLFVFHKWRLLCGELLKHASDGSGTDTEMPGQGVAGRRFLFGAAQLQHRLQIIVYRLRVVGPASSRWH